MKTPTVSAHALIHALKREEQEECYSYLKKEKLFKSAALFHLMRGMKKYNEAALKKKLREKEEISDVHFAVRKKDLYDALLSFLLERHQSVSKELHTLLETVEVLLERELYDEAAACCEKVKKIALGNGYYYLAIEANYRKIAILQKIAGPTFKKELAALKIESTGYTDQMRLNFRLGVYYLQVSALTFAESNVRSEAFKKEVAELRADKDFNLDAADKSYPFYMSAFLAMAKHYLYLFSGEFEEAYIQEKIVWNKLQANWDTYFKTKSAEVASAVVNYMDALSFTGRTDEFREHIAFAETLLTKEIQKKGEIEAAIAHYSLLDLIKTKKEKILGNEIAPYAEIYRGGALDLHQDIKRQYEFLLCRAYFLAGLYDEANKCFANIEAHERTQIRQDILEYGLFLKLLNRFTEELANSFAHVKRYLSTALKSYQTHVRHQKEKGNDYRVEESFLGFFSSIQADSSKKEVREQLDKFHEKLNGILQEKSGYVAFMNFLFDFEIILQRWKTLLRGAMEK